VFHDLAHRKECRIEEGHLMPDHVHMLIIRWHRSSDT
jgi:putative transposase